MKISSLQNYNSINQYNSIDYVLIFMWYIFLIGRRHKDACEGNVETKQICKLVRKGIVEILTVKKTYEYQSWF